MPTLDVIFAERKFEPPLFYGISNRLLFRELTPQRYLAALFETPAQIIQWREKDLSREENRGFVKTGSELASKGGKIFLVNGDVELALQERADGAHLTSRQDLKAAVRRREETGLTLFLLGKSVHSVPEAIRAESQGADYVLLAPVFDPISKGSYTAALGLGVLREAVESLSIPVFALGGITEENCRLVLDSGAVGIAGISWVSAHLRRILARQ